MKLKLIYISLLLSVASVLSAQETGQKDSHPDNGWKPEEDGAYVKIEGGSDLFEDSPEYDVTKALYGKFSGLYIGKGSGSNATNVASYSLHGRTPLLVVDGVPRDFTDITAEEIESIVVLKDAVSSALYGVKGANGVIQVTTKRGVITPLKVTAKYQYGVHTPFRNPDFADAFTYAGKLNEALTLDGLDPKYNAMELEAFRTHEYPYYYPDVDWMSEIYKKAASNHRLMLTFRGGQKKFRYYTVVDYLYDNALYRNQSDDDRYNVNHYDTRLSVRGNIDVDITRTTFMKLGVMARLASNNRANVSGLESAVYKTPAAAFPIKNEDGTWGGSSVLGKNNPVALLNDSGAFCETNTSVVADFNLKQDLGSLVKGLSADVGVSFDYMGSLTDYSSKEYRYSEVIPTLTMAGVLSTRQIWYGTDSKTLSHGSGFKSLAMRSQFHGRVNYDLLTGRHSFNAQAVYRQRSYTFNGRNTSSKVQEMYLKASYNYADRYLVDVVANWSGTAYLPRGGRFRFYPAANIGWVMSNETFMHNVPAISYLKFFVSGGLSGYDGNMEHELYRQSYIWSRDYMFNQNPSAVSGMTEGPLPSDRLMPEQSARISGGFDFRMLDDRLSIYAEAFKEHRSHILITAQDVSGIIGIGLKQLDRGIQDYSGADFAVSWKDKAGDFGYGIGINGAYLTTKLIEDGQAYQQYDYLYHRGNPVHQIYGLEAVGFFKDAADIASSPQQTFSDVRPGDIKYRDQNGDNRIDDEDVVPLEGTTLPKFTFGINLDFSYRNWELSAAFSGRTGVKVNLLNSPLYKPIVDNSTISDTFLEREVTWTPENADRATMPRLTTLSNANNYRSSSLWYRDGSFLKLRNLMLSYTFKKEMIKFSDMKVYIQATDLFSIDNIGFADPEQLGAAYPATRAFWIGVKFNF